jgi:N-acetylglucosaminyl-diphospho-decaprenol L-rhamnosyltransferase
LYFRRGPEIVETVRRLQQQSLAPAEIVLVDNNSDDGVVDSLDLLGVTVLTLERNAGYGAGMNEGMAALSSSADFVLLVTHELLPNPDCVERMLAIAEQTDAVAVGPTLFLPDGSVWAGGGRLDWRGNARHYRDDVNVPRDVEWLDGACVLVRRQDAAAIGGLDESFFLYWEDVDFSRRLAQRGRIVVAPHARATQAPSTGAGQAYYVARNRLWFWRRRRAPHLVVLSLTELLLWGVKRGVAHGWRDFLAVLRGCRDGLLAG